MFFDHLSPEVLTSLGALVVALVVASIVVSRKDPNTESGLELRLRVQTWWWIVGLFALALALDQTIAILFFAFVSFLALKEYLSLIPTRRADRRVLFWAYLSIPVQFYWVYIGWYGMFVVFIPVYMFLLLPVRMITVGATDGFLRAAALGQVF